MEEFKYLEGIIDLCVKELYTGDRNIHATLGYEELKELQNLLNKERALERHAEILINKNKELEETNDILSGVIRPLTELGEEHLEMINLMAIQLAKRQSFMKKVCKECIYDECIESKPKNCIIDYFKKKAKGE